jgi:hypothetical protein
MHNASLDHGLRKHSIDRLGKALQAIDDGDQNVTNATVLQLVHDAQPELGAFGLLDPDAEYLLGAIRANAKRNVDGLVADKAFVADFDPYRVEENERIADIQRSVLPFRDLLQDRIGDR